MKNVTKTFLSPDYNENTKILMRSPKHDVDQRKNAITKYRVLDSADKAALLEVQPLTGKLEKKLCFYSNEFEIIKCLFRFPTSNTSTFKFWLGLSNFRRS